MFYINYAARCISEEELFLGGAVIDIWECVLIENNGHLAEMTETFFVSRQKIRAAERALLVHGKTPFIIPCQSNGDQVI